MKEKMEKLYELKREMEFKKAVFDHETKSYVEEIKRLEKEIKTEILSTNNNAVTDNGLLTATITKGRETWDTKELQKLSETIPSILAFKKVGSPSVKFTLRKQPVKVATEKTSKPVNESWE